MRIIVLLTWACLIEPSFGAELCLQDTWDYCCGGFPPCDFIEPTAWVGYRTDAAPCEDFGQLTFAALTLSSSLHNPYLNSGPIPEHGRLYVWNVGYGTYPEGVGFETYVAGDIAIWGYEPISEGDHAWDPLTGHLVFDSCGSHRPNVVGAFVVGPGTVAVEDESWGRMKARYR